MNKDLATVRRAAAKAAQARENLRAAIHQARETASLREIAQAAGLSHEQVRRLTNEER